MIVIPVNGILDLMFQGMDSLWITLAVHDFLAFVLSQKKGTLWKWLHSFSYGSNILQICVSLSHTDCQTHSQVYSVNSPDHSLPLVD